MTAKIIFYLKKYTKKYCNKIGIHRWDYTLMVPRMLFSEYVFFKSFLHQHSKALYLESGSGGSTILADQLELSYYAYETDANFVDYMNGLLRQRRVEHLQVGEVVKFGFPAQETPAKAEMITKALNKHFPLKENPYCVVFIDGRCRVATALELVQHLSPKDFVLVHDFERPHYQELLKVFEPVEQIERLVVLKQKEIATPFLKELQEKYGQDFR